MLDFKYVGGVARKSPIRLAIPESGHWYLVVDMEGHHGLAESSVKLITARPRQKRARHACSISARIALLAKLRPPFQPLADLALEAAFRRIVKVWRPIFSGK